MPSLILKVILRIPVTGLKTRLIAEVPTSLMILIGE
jgi:hypothetical protein